MKTKRNITLLVDDHAPDPEHPWFVRWDEYEGQECIQEALDEGLDASADDEDRAIEEAADFLDCDPLDITIG